MTKNKTNPMTRVAMPVLKNDGLSSKISSHFGKSKGFIIINSDGSDCQYLDTKSARRAQECAPIGALVEHACHAIMCRSMGRGAMDHSREAGLLIYKLEAGETVAEALASFSEGKCLDFPESALCSHTEHCH